MLTDALRPAELALCEAVVVMLLPPDNVLAITDWLDSTLLPPAVMVDCTMFPLGEVEVLTDKDP